MRKKPLRQAARAVAFTHGRIFAWDNVFAGSEMPAEANFMGIRRASGFCGNVALKLQ
jgi:hypothetical protein